MSWVKIDDNFSEHPKVIKLSDSSFRLHIRVMCYCSKFLTDGIIEDSTVDGMRGKVRDVRELVGAGLWDVVQGGWQIHDYLEYNWARQDVEAKRVAAKERMGKLRSPNVRANKERSSGEVPAKFANPIPIPIPIPDPQLGSSEVLAAPVSAAAADPEQDWTARCIREWERATGTLLTPLIVENFDDALKEFPVDWVIDAIRETGLSRARSWRYTQAILNRWKQDGRDEAPRVLTDEEARRQKWSSPFPGLQI